VVFEQRMAGSPIAGTVMSITDANRLRTEVGRSLFNSVNHPDRRPHGQAGFAETGFLARTVARLGRTRADPAGAAAIPGLDPAIAQKLLKVAPNITRSRLLTMDLQQIATRMKLTLAEAARVRRAVLGLERQYSHAERPDATLPPGKPPAASPKRKK
jgi:hypothetical protein